MVFSLKKDARRVMAVLPKRFERFGLRLHPEKTRLIDFRRCQLTTQAGDSGQDSKRKVFDLLGFTHYWGRTRRGGFVVKRKTAKDRFGRSLKRVAQWCRNNRHLPLGVQHQNLIRKLQGYYQYYGITGNQRALARFLYELKRIWRKWLARRSQKRDISWDRFICILTRYPLPEPNMRRLAESLAVSP